MAHDPVAARYAEALFNAAKADGTAPAVLEQLLFIGTLLRDSSDLTQLMRNPDVDPEDKVGLLDRVLQGRWAGAGKAFIAMVVSMGRAELLPEIVDAFQEAVDADEGRLRVLVRSVHPLPGTVIARLRASLERRERKSIELTTELAPELLGGVQIHLGHRVIDGSVRRQLTELRERLAAVRV